MEMKGKLLIGYLEGIVGVEKDMNSVVHCHEGSVARVMGWVRVPSVHEH